MYHDATNAYIDGVGATALKLLIDGTAEIDLTATAMSPSTSDGNALGTASLMWSDLFLASGGVINFNNGDVTLTHSADVLTLAGGNLAIGADDLEIILGAGSDWGMLWSDADADNHAAVLYVSDVSSALHICNAAEKATDWNLTADTHPTLYIHCDGANAATDYMRLFHDDTNGAIEISTGTLYFKIAGTAEMYLSTARLALEDNTLTGSGAVGGDLKLESTLNATKGCVTIADAQQGLKIGGTADRATTESTNALVLFDGTAPAGTLTSGVTLYSAAGELNVMDAGGTATLLSPHDSDGNWVFRSYTSHDNKTLVIHMEKLIRRLVAKFPEFKGMLEEYSGNIV
jgi:hypothetical protein